MPQPWEHDAKTHPLTEEALRVFMDQLEARAREREQRLMLFLALVPLLWGGIAFLLWRFLLTHGD